MHSVRRRLISSAVVMIVGVLSALPFYRVKPESAPATESPQIETPESESSSSRALQVPASELSSTLSSTVGASEAAQLVSATADTRTAALNSEAQRSAAEIVPQLPNKHPRARETVPPAAPVRRVAEDVQSIRNTSIPPDEENLARQRMHWIRDGDTLEDIAFRFLGDRTRWKEILECNRDILADKDLLPIGKQIRIPSKVKPTSKPDTGLVPIPWHESL